MTAIELIDDPVVAAAVLAFRVTRAQAFGEGNERTALLLARWVPDRNGQDGAVLLPPDDHQVAELLVTAASGQDVEAVLVALLRSVERPPPVHNPVHKLGRIWAYWVVLGRRPLTKSAAQGH